MTDNPLRVLVCEDDPRLAALIEDLLDRDGRFLVVGHAATPTEALRLVETHGPDLVLMDIGLQGGDGIAATRAIRARDAKQHVVIYTGSDEYEDVARADDAGAAGFLHKDALTSPDLPEALHVLHTNYVAQLPDPE